jgi:hypothetical protein
MEPETRIALVKMAEKAKRIQAEEYSGRWIKLGYIGAVLVSLWGTSLMSSAIALISRGDIFFLGTLYLLVTLILTLLPWYFIVRYNYNRHTQLLCDAILSVNQDQSGFTVQPLAQPEETPHRVITKAKVARKKK